MNDNNTQTVEDSQPQLPVVTNSITFQYKSQSNLTKKVEQGIFQ